jgi:purine nucleosidase
VTAARPRILLDTDIGGDFDDANALALLAVLEGIDLVAVTTVGAGGSALHRARLASHLLAAAGREDVPVHAGIDRPIAGDPVLSRLAPDHILNGYVEEMAGARVSAVHAVDALVAAAETWGPSLVLVCIGALTNVAAAFQRAPEVMRRIGRLVFMGGAFASQFREANVAIDPEAAALVFASGVPVVAVGVEEARRSALPLAAYADPAFARSPLGSVLAAMASRYRAAYRTERVVLYDVTTAAAAVRPDWFSFAQVRVAVELAGTHTRGCTVVEQDEFFNAVAGAVPIGVAQDHDAAAVAELFRREVLERASAGEGAG